MNSAHKTVQTLDRLRRRQERLRRMEFLQARSREVSATAAADNLRRAAVTQSHAVRQALLGGGLADALNYRTSLRRLRQLSAQAAGQLADAAAASQLGRSRLLEATMQRKAVNVLVAQANNRRQRVQERLEIRQQDELFTASVATKAAFESGGWND